jgi:hypothetical protein
MAAGMMYIADSFKTVGRTDRERGRWPLDNDPHFWSSPPTWGICRPDLRKKAAPGHTIFFVLSKYAQHPQMIFGYMRIRKIVTHAAAYRRLAQKRMGPRMPNGNIIVNAAGRYNEWDGGSHKHNFWKIRDYYAIGEPAASRFLTPAQVARKAPEFIDKLCQVLGRNGARAIDMITRAGCHALSEAQVSALKRWIDEGLPHDDRGFGEAPSPRSPHMRPRLPSSCGPGGHCVPPVRKRDNCGRSDCAPGSGTGRNAICIRRTSASC